MSKIEIPKFVLFISLGFIGAFLNFFPVNFGWGLDIILGQAIIIAFKRLISPAQFVAASVISSSVTLLLWHHPWAWFICILEAATLAAFARRTSLAAVDAAFWLLIGAPLLFLSYGLAMKMGTLDLVLVIAKQSSNGILNVALGELGYLGLYAQWGKRSAGTPKLSLEAAVSSSLIVLCSMPLLVQARLSAKESEYTLRNYASASADASLERAIHTLRHERMMQGGVAAPLAGDDFAPIRGLDGAQNFREKSTSVYLQSEGHIARLISGPVSNGLATSACRQVVPGNAALLTSSAFGIPAMTSFRTGVLVKCVELGSASKKLIAIVRLDDEISIIRERQTQIISTILVLFLFFILVTRLFAQNIQGAVNRIMVRAMGFSLAEAVGGYPDDPKASVSEFFKEIDNLESKLTLATMEAASQQDRLRAAQRVLQSVSKSAPIGIYSSDLDAHIGDGTFEFSAGVERLIGRVQPDLGQVLQWKDLVHPADLERVLGDKATLPESGHISIEYRLLHSEGHYIWVLDSASVEIDRPRGSHQIVGVLIDVSARKRAEQQLLHADKMASLGRMAVGIAHELNQPLHIIRMAVSNLSHVLRPETYSHPLAMQKIGLISAQINRGASVIRQMKLYGQFPREDIAVIDVDQAIRSVVDVMSPLLEESKIKPTYLSGVENPRIVASPIAFEQILVNLLENATDAVASARQNGRNASRIHIGLDQCESWLILGVEDDGGGIPASISDHVFDPFFTTKPPVQGTGLGLSIAYSIAKSLGGDLTFVNVGSGVRFDLKLPVAE